MTAQNVLDKIVGFWNRIGTKGQWALVIVVFVIVANVLPQEQKVTPVVAEPVKTQKERDEKWQFDAYGAATDLIRTKLGLGGDAKFTRVIDDCVSEGNAMYMVVGTVAYGNNYKRWTVEVQRGGGEWRVVNGPVIMDVK